VNWISGPGTYYPNSQPWSTLQSNYSFVDNFVALRPQVVGDDNIERFDFWANSFLYMKEIARFSCQWYEFNKMNILVKNSTNDPAQRRTLNFDLVLPQLQEMVAQLTNLMYYLQMTVSSMGEFGTIMNVEQQSKQYFYDMPASDLRAGMGYIGCYNDKGRRDLNGSNFGPSASLTPGLCLLFCEKQGYMYYGVQEGSFCFCGNSYGSYGMTTYTYCNVPCAGDPMTDCGGPLKNSVYSVKLSVLPQSAIPSQLYSGLEPKLIVPTARSELLSSEVFFLKAMVLSQKWNSNNAIQFWYRKMGSNAKFTGVSMMRTSPMRQVFTVTLPLNQTTDDFEYFIQAKIIEDWGTFNKFFPVTAPTTCHTVVVH